MGRRVGLLALVLGLLGCAVWVWTGTGTTAERAAGERPSDTAQRAQPERREELHATPETATSAPGNEGLEPPEAPLVAETSPDVVESAASEPPAKGPRRPIGRMRVRVLAPDGRSFAEAWEEELDDPLPYLQVISSTGTPTPAPIDVDSYRSTTAGLLGGFQCRSVGRTRGTLRNLDVLEPPPFHAALFVGGQLVASLPVGEHEEEIVFRVPVAKVLDLLAEVKLEVVDESGAPLAAEILLSQGSIRGGMCRDGRARFRALPPGTYYVQVAPRPSGWESTKVSVHVEAGERHDLGRLVSQRVVPITGRVLDENGKPGVVYLVTTPLDPDTGAALQDDGPRSVAATGPNGEFRIENRSSGVYLLHHDLHRRAYRGLGIEALRVDTRGGPLTDLALVAYPLRRVSVIVMGKRLRAMCTLVDRSGHELVREADGISAFLVPGTYCHHRRYRMDGSVRSETIEVAEDDVDVFLED